MPEHVIMVTAGPLASVAGRLEYIRDTCEYPDWTSLAKDLGVSPQAVDNWRRRQAIGPKNRKRLRDKTGASIEWLESGVGTPFPEGARRYIGQVPQAAGAAIARNEQAIDQLRSTVLVLIDLLTETKPDVAREMAERLEETVLGEVAKQSWHLRLVRALRERSLSTKPHSHQHAPPAPRPHKRAS